VCTVDNFLLRFIHAGCSTARRRIVPQRSAPHRLQACSQQVGLGEFGERHDTLTNGCTIHRSRLPDDQSDKRVARLQDICGLASMHRRMQWQSTRKALSWNSTDAVSSPDIFARILAREDVGRVGEDATRMLTGNCFR